MGPARPWPAALAHDVVRGLRGHDLVLYAAAVTFYAGIAIVPSLLVAVRAAAVIIGREDLLAYSGQLQEALPTALGAPGVVADLFAAGVSLSWVGVLIAAVPATLYGEGLRRAFVGLLDVEDSFVGWRGRLGVLPLFGAAPVLLIAVLLTTPLLARLFSSGEAGPTALGVYVALNVDWLALGPVMTYVYRVVGPQRPSWRACLWGGFVTGAFVSGFLQGFVLFLALPLDLGAPFGGFVGVGAMVAVGLWLWVLHAVTLVGYRFTAEVDRRDGRPWQRPVSRTRPDPRAPHRE